VFHLGCSGRKCEAILVALVKTAHFFVVLRKMFLTVLSSSYEAVHSMDNFNFVRNGLIESCEVILITSHTSLHFTWTPRIALFFTIAYEVKVN
jgi:hypothetical protein